jgi:hypothetical protein
VSAPSPEELNLFDPWSDEAPGAPSPRFAATGALEPGLVVPEPSTDPESPRWESPPSEGVEPPGPPPDPVTHPSHFLRSVVVPEFQRFARRLEASRHYTTVQDLLDLPTPTVRVLIWPRPGLLDPSDSRILATFQLMLERSASRVRTSYWLGARPGVVIPMAEVTLDQLAFPWVETQLLDFLQRVLDRV